MKPRKHAETPPPPEMPPSKRQLVEEEKRQFDEDSRLLKSVLDDLEFAAAHKERRKQLMKRLAEILK
jgi:hypothetical protein